MPAPDAIRQILHENTSSTVWAHLFLRCVALALPVCVCWTLVISLSDGFPLLVACGPVVATACAASFLGGSSSLTMGAIIYPVLTLLLDYSPLFARDLTFALQAVGLGLGSLLLLWMGVPLDLAAVQFVSVSAICCQVVRCFVRMCALIVDGVGWVSVRS